MYGLPLCLDPRMHEGQNRVPGSIYTVQKSAKLGYDIVPD